jgi:hypothetical protein
MSKYRPDSWAERHPTPWENLVPSAHWEQMPPGPERDEARERWMLDERGARGMADGAKQYVAVWGIQSLPAPPPPAQPVQEAQEALEMPDEPIPMPPIPTGPPTARVRPQEYQYTNRRARATPPGRENRGKRP